MTNPVEPSSETLVTDSLHAGEYAYGFATLDFGVFEVPGTAAPPDAEAPADAQADAPADVADVDVPFAAHAPITPAIPPLPDGVVSSPSLDLSFLTQAGAIPTPSPKLAEATQPDPSSAVSPSMPSSPDVHPTEMPATPVSTGVAETNASEANALSGLSPVNVEAPAPSSIETPPAPVAAPPGPITGEPNVAVGQLPTGAAAPASAVGTPPIHPEPKPPDAAGMQVQMSQNLAEQMASILQDVLRSKSP
jgi:hypothetical protein